MIYPGKCPTCIWECVLCCCRMQRSVRDLSWEMSHMHLRMCTLLLLDAMFWICLLYLLVIITVQVTLLSGLECSGTISARCNLRLLGSSDAWASACWVSVIPAMRHHTQLIFVLLVEAGFHHFWSCWAWTPGLKWSTRLRLQKCWDYRHKPLFSAQDPLCLTFDKYMSQEPHYAQVFWVL